MDMKQQAAHPVDAGIEAKKAEALELRIAGKSYRTIAREMGISKSSAQEYVAAALGEIRESNREAAEEVRRLEMERLDALLAVLWDKKDQPRVADTILRVSERRSRLLGLDIGKGEGDDVPPAAGLNVMPGAFQIMLVTPDGAKVSATPQVMHTQPPTPDTPPNAPDSPASSP